MWAFLGSYPTLGGPLTTNKNILNDLAADVTAEWAMHETNRGGFKSYYKNDEDKLKTEKLYSFSPDPTEKVSWSDITGNLLLRLFSQSELETFNPPDRWISYEEFLRRLAERCSNEEAEALIDKKLDKNTPGFSRELTMRYPVTIIEQTKDECMYSVSEIEAIEIKEFPVEKSKQDGVGKQLDEYAMPPSPSANIATDKQRRGRPEINPRRVALLKRIMIYVETTSDRTFAAKSLPGTSENLLKACKDFVKKMDSNATVFKGVSVAVMHKLVREAGFGFRRGPKRADESELWTELFGEILTKNDLENFRQ
jgi:hypothetical protein